MATTTVKPTQSKARRLRRKSDSFADWMARMDTQVEAVAQEVCSRVPMERVLNGAQRRILEMLAEYMRSLPALEAGEEVFQKKAYDRINSILREVFLTKYPDWAPRKDGRWYGADLPAEAYQTFIYLLRNCGGRAPEDTKRRSLVDLLGEDD